MDRFSSENGEMMQTVYETRIVLLLFHGMYVRHNTVPLYLPLW